MDTVHAALQGIGPDVYVDGSPSNGLYSVDPYVKRCEPHLLQQHHLVEGLPNLENSNNFLHSGIAGGATRTIQHLGIVTCTTMWMTLSHPTPTRAPSEFHKVCHGHRHCAVVCLANSRLSPLKCSTCAGLSASLVSRAFPVLPVTASRRQRRIGCGTPICHSTGADASSRTSCACPVATEGH